MRFPVVTNGDPAVHIKAFGPRPTWRPLVQQRGEEVPPMDMSCGRNVAGVMGPYGEEKMGGWGKALSAAQLELHQLEQSPPFSPQTYVS